VPKVQPIPTANTGRGRRGRRLRVSTSLAEINVVPLVDVMLVLLIIFMVAAPMMTQGMAVNLPQARKAPPLAPTQITVTVPAAFARDHIVQIGKDEMRVDILAERMRQAMLERTDKSVMVRADGGVQWKDVVYVMDQLKTAGVEHVGVATRPEGTR
jgi:biopolymer transport protein TolR